MCLKYHQLKNDIQELMKIRKNIQCFLTDEVKIKRMKGR